VYLENLARGVWEVRRAGQVEQNDDGQDQGDDEDPDGESEDGPMRNVPIRLGLYHRKSNGPPQRAFAIRVDYDALGAPSRISSDVMRGGDELAGALTLPQRVLLALKEHPRIPVFKLAELVEDDAAKTRVALGRLGGQVVSLEQDYNEGGKRARTVWALRARE
jgi:hypothetical protein